jgi:type III secretion protein O
MMAPAYPLEDLLRVRSYREEEAAAKVTQCRSAVERAAQVVDECNRALHEYSAWRVQREAELYQELFRQQVQLKELDDLKFEILQLREQESLYVQQVHDAEKALQEARDALYASRKLHHAAYKDVEKIGAHKGIWAREIRKQNEEFEERELEDFRVTSDDLNEDDGEADDA